MTHDEQVFAAWIDEESLAEAAIPIVGSLYRRQNVVTTVHGRRLVGLSANQVLKAHRFARHLDGVELQPSDTFPVLGALASLDLGPAVIDVAALLRQFREHDREDGGSMDLTGFLRAELADVVGHGDRALPPTDVVLYGFGRIGRLVTRILLARAGGASGLRLRAVVLRPGARGDLTKRASLLRRDSIHGPFDGTITVDEDAQTITANGTVLQVIRAQAPDQVDYRAHGIDDAVVVDSTGRWRDRAGLERHLAAPGAGRVLLTTAANGDVPNVVHGVNDGEIGDERVLAAASCTTNAVTPVLAALHERYGVRHGHVETVHAFTNDQNLTDNHHSADRRGRAATLNMVITETGAAKAVGAAYPELAGRLSGNAIRVPVSNGSLAVLSLQLEGSPDRAELNAFLRDVSLVSSLRRQVDYVESPEFASSDVLGSRKAGVVDGLATIADGDGSAVVYVWYDNEHGYSRQVVRVLESMTGVRLPAFPRDRADDAGRSIAPLAVAER
ncbi:MULTISPECIES: glyceraldehyde-3-phosphate dehydrogenase [unclassified Curtobacterium]|uniref:glyceraldehyde-3-phosphate dehydrogenase n=1 Tax=unclassified Curtobacterium TaxID=257496 RepID=UPI00382348EF